MVRRGRRRVSPAAPAAGFPGGSRGPPGADPSVVHERIAQAFECAHEARAATAAQVSAAAASPFRGRAASVAQTARASSRLMNGDSVPATAQRTRWQRIAARLDAYERLIRLDKPIGTLLLLWPTLSALWIASYGSPSWIIVGIFVLGTLLMRSAGCAINDYADRDFDAYVERTANRPLARRELERWAALGVGAVLALCAFLLVLRLNAVAIMLSVVALAIAIAYPFFKRFFLLPQAFLGIAFSFGIPMAFAAVYGDVPLTGWAMFAANLFWVMAYDT